MVMENSMEDFGNGFEMGKYSKWFSIGLDDNMAPRGTQRPFLRDIFLKRPESSKSASEPGFDRAEKLIEGIAMAYDTLSGYVNLKKEEMPWVEGNLKW